MRLSALLLLCAGVAAQNPGGAPSAPFDAEAFRRHLVELGAGDEALARLAAAPRDGATAESALRQLVEPLDRAIRLAEAGQPRAALALAELVAGTEDPWVRAHARYHLARVFVDGNDPDHAVQVLADFLREDRGRTPLDAEVLYFYGHALAGVPNLKAAKEALHGMLSAFPEAPAELRAAATKELAELEARDGPLHEIADAMRGIELRIRRTDTGATTQQRQAEVIGRLELLLEQVTSEERRGGAPSGLSEPAAPAASSAAPAGETRVGDLRDVPGVVDRWGAMKDRERDAIEADLRTKLPGHYQKMIEDYYRRLNEGGP
ncbi:MAG: hypothetical protein AAF628_06405 [Planctomycetota bacterium]